MLSVAGGTSGSRSRIMVRRLADLQSSAARRSAFTTNSISGRRMAAARSSRLHQTSSNRRFQSTSSAKEAVLEPEFTTLRLVFLGQMIPFIGFGFMDNAILIIAGDAIDTSLGVVLGISTLCAAAIGNIISDLAGIAMGTAIEDFCAQTLKLPLPNLTTAQRRLRSVRFAGQLGMAAGMIVGCVIGMFPLFFIDTKKNEQMKKKAHLESLFRDVVTEAKTLIGAESTCLYLRVEEHKDDGKHRHLPYRPSVDGDHLYAMYYVLPDKTKVTSKAFSEEGPARFMPLGRGIVSRAILTGEAWNIQNVHAEPDFSPELDSTVPERFQHMIVVPVLDGQGRAIAVIRAMNKIKSTGSDGFSGQDVQILKSLASHISVSLQTVYQDQGDEEMRLRDTIRILKEHGLQGIETNDKKGSTRKHPRLFPEH